MAIIGTAYVHIRADDKYFESDVRKATARIKNVNIQLKADVDLTKATKKIRDLRYRITSKDAVLKVDANVEKAEAKMAKLLAKFLKSDVEFRAVAKTAEANAELDKLRNRYTAKGIPFTAQADTRAANAALKTLTRERTANIRALVDPASQKALQGMFNTLTGTISAAKIKATIAGLAGNFEGLAVKATAAQGAVLALSAALLTTGSNVLAIGGDIMQAVGLVALVPTAIGSMAAIITTAKMAFKGFGEAFSSDAKKAAEAMAKLPPEAQKAVKGLKGVYTQIQKPVQNAFWEVMGTSLQDTVKKLIPSLITGLSNVGRGFGAVTKEILGGFERMGDGSLQRMLDNLGQGLKNMAPGFGALTDAFGILGETGATYLPRFGTWVTELGTQFRTFIEDAEKSGQIKIWIDEGVQSLQEMASIVKSTSGIFSGLTNAARLAGAPGLTEMAESLRNIRDIVNTEPFQSRLVTVLEGARSGAEKMGAGFKNLTTFMGESSIALGVFLDEAGELAGLTFDSIRTLFDGTGLGAGLFEALEGFKQMVADLQPGFANLGSAVGGLGEIADEMFRNLAPGLNQLFETIEGVVNGIKQGVIDAMPVFNQFIQSILELAQGPIIALAEGIGNLLTTFSQLPSGIQTMIMSLGLFALALKVIGPKWASFTDGIRKNMADADSSVGRNLRNIQSGTRDMGSAFTRVTQEATDRGVRSFTGFGASITDTMKATATGMRQNMGTAFNALPPFAQKAVSGIKNAFSNIGAGFVNGLIGGRELDTVRAGFERLPESAKTSAENIRRNFQTAFTNFGNLIAPADSAVRTMATQMNNNLAPARNAFSNLADHARTATVNAASQMGAGLKTAMSGLTGFLGGPIGIALMAATVVIGEFAAQHSKAQAQVDNLANAFQISGGRIDSAARKVIATNLDVKKSFLWMEFDSGLDIAEKVGVPLKDVVDAASGVPGAMEKVQNALGQTGNSATKFGTAFGLSLDTLKNSGGLLGGIADIIDKTGLWQSEGDKLNRVIEDQKRVIAEAKKKNEDLAESLGIGTVASARLTKNYDVLRDAASSVSSRVEALKDNLDILNTSMDTGHRAGRNHAETMFNMVDNMKTLHGATETTIDANGRMNDSYRKTLLNIDGTFSTANRQAIDFSKEMDTVSTSILTVGMEEMKRLQDAGAKLPEAQAGAMKVMNTATEELRTKLGVLGFDAGEVNTILAQMKLNPDQLQAALVVNTEDAERDIMRFELMKAAVLQGNWEVALSASSEEVQNTILGTEEMRKAYESGGWEAVVKLKDQTGKGFSELMTKITLAKDESEVTAILRAEFPDSFVFDNAKKIAEEYDRTDVKATLGIKDEATLPIGKAKDALIGYNLTPTLDKLLKGVNLLGEPTKAAQATMDAVVPPVYDLLGRDLTKGGVDDAKTTMGAVVPPVYDLLGRNLTGTAVEGAKSTMNGLPNKTAIIDGDNKPFFAALGTVRDTIPPRIVVPVLAQYQGSSGAMKTLVNAAQLADGGFWKNNVQLFANGGIMKKAAAPAIKAYANGGVENHVAQIAYKSAAVPMRIWAEAEGGEAYIPLAKTKRKRSLEILRQVMAEFGLQKYAMFADGGFNNKPTTPSVVSSRYSTPSASVMQAGVSAGPTVITNVYPSAGLNETQISDSVSENIYWKLSTKI